MTIQDELDKAARNSTFLTKREMFAMAAMQGILSSRKLQECILHDIKHDKTTSESCFAVFAVKQADELLKQLEK